MRKGKIILFNGVPSSGKTTLSKVLQNRLPEVFFLLEIDMYAEKGFNLDALTDIAPDKFKNHAPIIKNDDPITNLTGFYNVVKIFSDLGLNVVVDTVFAKNMMPLYVCLDLLYDYPVLFVHVISPLEEIRRRERERIPQKIGAGETILPLIEPQDTYDITVDTFNETNEKCADRIIELLEYTEKHTAFKTLWSQRNK